MLEAHLEDSRLLISLNFLTKEPVRRQNLRIKNPYLRNFISRNGRNTNFSKGQPMNLGIVGMVDGT